jgi:hypothetical protein
MFEAPHADIVPLMKAFVVLILMVSTAFAEPLGKGKGAKLKFDAAEGDVAPALAQIAETGRLSIVLVDVPPTTVKLPTELTPWDIAFEDILTAAKLERDGGKGPVQLVGQPAWIAEHKKQKAKKYSGAAIMMQARDADAAAIGQLLALATGKRIGIANGQHPVTMVLRRVPGDQAVDLVLAQSGATAEPKPAAVAAPSKACVAANVQSAALKLVAVAGRNGDFFALFLDDKGTPVFATTGTCLGSDKAKLAAFHNNNTIDLSQGGALRVISVP